MGPAKLKVSQLTVEKGGFKAKPGRKSSVALLDGNVDERSPG